MVVDDQERYARGITRLLVQRGLSVVAFTSSLAAREALDSEPFDVLISDIGMPGVSGFELVEHLHHVKPGVPAILMSGNTDPERVAQALETGAVAFVDKLNGIGALCAEVERAIGGKTDR